MPFLIPRSFSVGDVFSWSEILTKYSPAEYDLILYIRGETQVDLTGQKETGFSGWKFTLEAASSNSLTAGQYWGQYIVSKSDERISLDTIELTVKPNFASLTTYDGRSSDQLELDRVSQAIVDISNKGISEYQIKGRKVVYQDLDQLIRLRDRLRRRIAKAQNRGQSGINFVNFR